ITLLPTTHLALNAPATPEIYTLSLHDALPIWRTGSGQVTTVGFTIPEGSFGFWVKRLRDLHIESSRATRFEGDVITIHDPDGIQLDLVAGSSQLNLTASPEGPVPTAQAIPAPTPRRPTVPRPRPPPHFRPHRWASPR